MQFSPTRGLSTGAVNVSPSGRGMMRTQVTQLLGIKIPIIQAGMVGASSAELAAAVSQAGALGSLGAAGRPVAGLKAELERLKGLTGKPFAVNHTLPLDEEAFALTLATGPVLVSFALGDAGTYITRAHAAGMLVMQQVTTVRQATEAAERGADLIVAQGGEAGGFGGTISTLVLVPQVVDAVLPLPVIAAGGIADGRGLVAALALGAQGVNVGTRFLASQEARVGEAWKHAILEAGSQEPIKFEAWNDIMPAREGGYEVSPRVLHSPFVDRWQTQRAQAHDRKDVFQAEIGQAIAEGRFGELLPFTGQSAGLIREIQPAAHIVRDFMKQAEGALRHLRSLGA